ncbi:hypothetical protein [uncultured Flavobacterium sp.]|uniref:hypothetical protein n=1 Tax=uncultured Flavobacterium sp. TaxID=165435 RepID=UPI0030CA2CA8
MMKNKITTLLFLFVSIAFAQNKDCKIDFEEQTDSTYIKKTSEFLVHERVFGNSKEMIFLSLLNSNGVLMLGFQQIQKSADFIPAFCFDANSKIYFQLENGKIISLINSGQENCSTLNYDLETKSNIKVLTHFFLFLKENYEELAKSPISLMRIYHVSEKTDIVLKSELKSELLNTTSFPTHYFMDYLHCIDK